MLDQSRLFHIGIRVVDIEAYGRLTYVRSPSGYLAEPISIASKPRFERWWAGGALSEPLSQLASDPAPAS